MGGSCVLEFGPLVKIESCVFWNLEMDSSFKSTLPETNIAPENGWLEYDRFLFGRPIFRCYISFREGRFWMILNACTHSATQW